jgi:hypothetical protein
VRAMQHDPVNHPQHYTGHASGVECIQITEHMNFCLGNAVKYIWRAGEKGDAVEDLRKARWYLDREIARLLGGMGQDRRACVPSVAPVAAGEGASPPRVTAESGPPEVSPDAHARAELPAVPPVRRRKRSREGSYRTEARDAVLLRDWPAGVLAHDIIATMRALPGPEMPPRNLLPQWAKDRGVRRPDWFNARAAIGEGLRASHETRRARAAAGDGWAAILAWAETVDPDMVLKGSQAERLAQINELRVLEGLKPFVLAPLAEAA